LIGPLYRKEEKTKKKKKKKKRAKRRGAEKGKNRSEFKRLGNGQLAGQCKQHKARGEV